MKHQTIYLKIYVTMKYLKKFETAEQHEALENHPDITPLVCGTLDKHTYYHKKELINGGE